MREYKSLTEIAKDVRSELKAALPGWVFSVRVSRYSGGGSIALSLMSGPESAMYLTDGYAQLNQFTFLREPDPMYSNNGAFLTPTSWEVMRQATAILSAYHWDESDSMIDYHCCNFYMNIEIGQWHKPYTVKEAK